MAGNYFYGFKVNSSVVIWNFLDCVEKYRPRVPRATWVEAEKIHLTLRFIGSEVDESAAFDVLHSACTGQSDIQLTVRGAATFSAGKSKQPRVLYAKVAEGFPRLHELYKGLGGTGSYTPHLTLAKLERAGDTEPEFSRIAEELKDHAFGKILVTDVVLYRTQGNGQPYQAVASHRLCS